MLGENLLVNPKHPSGPYLCMTLINWVLHPTNLSLLSATTTNAAICAYYNTIARLRFIIMYLKIVLSSSHDHVKDQNPDIVPTFCSLYFVLVKIKRVVAIQVLISSILSFSTLTKTFIVDVSRLFGLLFPSKFVRLLQNFNSDHRPSSENISHFVRKKISMPVLWLLSLRTSPGYLLCSLHERKGRFLHNYAGWFSLIGSDQKKTI